MSSVTFPGGAGGHVANAITSMTTTITGSTGRPWTKACRAVISREAIGAVSTTKGAEYGVKNSVPCVGQRTFTNRWADSLTYINEPAHLFVNILCPTYGPASVFLNF